MSAVLPKLVGNEKIANHEDSNSSGMPAVLVPVRRGPRSEEIRIAEYTPFPREKACDQARLGFTRDVSALGMCLGVDHREPVGSLLRVDLRGLNGESIGASIARVVWCSDARDGRHWLGLDLLCETDNLRWQSVSDASN